MPQRALLASIQRTTKASHHQTHTPRVVHTIGDADVLGLVVEAGSAQHLLTFAR